MDDTLSLDCTSDARLGRSSFSKWFGIRMNTLFTTDSGGDLVSINFACGKDKGKGRPPLIFVAWSESDYALRFRDDVLADRRRKIEQHLRGVWSFDGAEQLPCANQIEDVLSAPCSEAGPAYLAPDTIQPQGTAIRVEHNEKEALRAHFERMIDDIGGSQPCFVVLDGGAAVSACRTVRRSAWAAEAGVNTVGAYRGKGYAVAVTSAWVSAVRSEGLLPMYSTSWGNTASQRVAEKVGLVQYAAEHQAW